MERSPQASQRDMPAVDPQSQTESDTIKRQACNTSLTDGD
jgi:hypothetical protein